MTYNLTRDEEIKKIILQYDPKAEQLVPKQEPVAGEGRPDITQTVNDKPEE